MSRDVNTALPVWAMESLVTGTKVTLRCPLEIIIVYGGEVLKVRVRVDSLDPLGRPCAVASFQDD